MTNVAEAAAAASESQHLIRSDAAPADSAHAGKQQEMGMAAGSL